MAPPRHVSWVLHPAVTIGWAVLCLAAAACLVVDPSLMPARGDLIWSGREASWSSATWRLAWTIVFLTQLGRTVAARAAGVPGRMSLSTRLQFLVAETDVTGVWPSPRRVRLTVYLAGIAVNLALAVVACWSWRRIGAGPPLGRSRRGAALAVHPLPGVRVHADRPVLRPSGPHRLP